MKFLRPSLVAALSFSIWGGFGLARAKTGEVQERNNANQPKAETTEPRAAPVETKTPEAKPTTGTSGTMEHEAATANLASTVVTFADMSPALTLDDQTKIKELLNQTKAKDEIKIAVWSDKPYSADATFSSEDKKLAKDRGEAIKKYVEGQVPKRKVDIVAMTEKPGMLAKMFNTDEEQIKSVFGKAETTGTAGSKSTGTTTGAKAKKAVTHQEAELMRDSGGPGKAVLVALHSKK